MLSGYGTFSDALTDTDTHFLDDIYRILLLLITHIVKETYIGTHYTIEQYIHTP